MIIKKIAFGDSNEAFIEGRLTSGFNIIFSDDNNKGKTIVMQSALYAIGNEPIFPSTFNFLDYYHYVQIVLDNGKVIETCRKGDSFVVKTDESISIIDGVSELKRYYNRIGFSFPVIIKNNVYRIVDPVLLYQVFFVGQDEKNSSTIFNDYFYKKDDFWNLLYAIAGFEPEMIETINQDEIKSKINLLSEEKKVLKSKSKIFKSLKNSSLDLVSQHRSNEAFDLKIKNITSLHNNIVNLTKARNRATSRKLANERTLDEIRSINRADTSGSLYCLECGSGRIGYSSGDKSYTFDITDKDMRRHIIESIQDKINAYEEEVQNCNRQMNELQKQLQTLLSEEEISLEAVLLYKNEIVESSAADSRLVEIDAEIKTLKDSLDVKSKKNQDAAEKREKLKLEIVSSMNYFYKKIDPNGTLEFDDLFAKKRSVFSGSEETEFYLSKLYAIAKVLRHNYPIMMDFFRDGELSSEKEEEVLSLFGELKNQKIFTATLKAEELGKYNGRKEINAIDYSSNFDSHILSSKSINEFKTIMNEMMVHV